MEEVNRFQCVFTITPKAKPRARHRSISKRVGKITHKITSSYYPNDYMEWQDAFTQEFKKEWGSRPKMEGPVMVILCFVIPLPASLSKKERAARLETRWHIQKPDSDNLEKAILDGMSKAEIWNDDCQVCSLTSQKRWGEVGSIEIIVEPM